MIDTILPGELVDIYTCQYCGYTGPDVNYYPSQEVRQRCSVWGVDVYADTEEQTICDDCNDDIQYEEYRRSA